MNMFSLMESTRRSSERCLDSQLWHACAGPVVQMPPVNSKVFYFPQGHAEHATGKVDFGRYFIPSLIACEISAIKYMADPDTDEVFVKMGLTPLMREKKLEFEDDYFNVLESQGKTSSFAKTLTQSDANNGGGFSVPRYCAETIFPRLDYSAEPPVQTIIAKDVHGRSWKFRHIYRGTPRRHLLTTGWSSFVNQKNLVAGDSVIFLRADNGDLCIGIKRKWIGGGTEYSSNWNQSALCPSGFLSKHENNTLMMRMRQGDEELKGRVPAESVVEAVTSAINNQPFEVVYYPRAGTPEFCVKASAVKAAMQIMWCSGMRFKMPFESEDSSRISWFMGTISSVQVADPFRWPNSPWRLLLVEWDEPDLLQNVKCVNPWMVELVAYTSSFHLDPYSPPGKKLRFLHHPDLPLVNQHLMPSFSSYLLNHSYFLCNIQTNSSAGIQGARHAQFGLSPSEFPFNKLHSDMLPGGLRRPNHAVQLVRTPCSTCKSSMENNGIISSFLTMGYPGQSLEKPIEAKSPHILLFGQLIHTEQLTSYSCSTSTNENSLSEENSLKTSKAFDGLASSLHQNSPIENSSDGGSPWYKDQHKSDLGTDNINLLCLAL